MFHFKHHRSTILNVCWFGATTQTTPQQHDKRKNEGTSWLSFNDLESSMSPVYQHDSGDSGAGLDHYLQREGGDHPGHHCNQRWHSKRCHWLADCQPQRGSWSVKFSSMVFGWSETCRLAAHPCHSVYINLSERLILKCGSLFPLLSAFAFLLMQEEMGCCRQNGDWICPHIHPPSLQGTRCTVSSSTTVYYA